MNGRKLNRYDKTQKVNLTKRRFDKVNSLEVYKKEIKMSCISNKDNGDFKKISDCTAVAHFRQITLNSFYIIMIVNLF